MDENENKAGRQEGNDFEIEARIVAWISGEASAFEAAELERLVREKPELAIFKRRIEAVRDLVADAVRPEKKPLKLSGEAREKLLKTIGAPEAAASKESKKDEDSTLVVYGRRHRTLHRWMVAAAACLVCALLFVTFLTPSLQRVRDKPAGAKGEFSRQGAEQSAVATPAKESIATLDSFGFKSESGKAPFAANGGAESQKSLGEARLATSRREAPVVLSPFVVSASEDKAGYKAASTLAGARISLNSELKKGAATNSVVTAPLSPDLQAKLDEAQQAPVGQEEVVSQAPAAAGSSEEKGTYDSNSTLAGTRVRTDLNDAASAATVVTAQFLADADQKDGQGGPTSNPTEAKAAPALNSQGSSEQVPGRDSVQPAGAEVFHVGRIGKPGPQNSIVFGAGSPAGLIDTGTNGAANPNVGRPIVANSPADGANASAIGLATTSESELSSKRAGAIGGKAPGPDSGLRDEANASHQPVSTFSLHVGDVSFRLAAQALAGGTAPDPAQIRPEEFYNALDYGDPMPALSELISCRIEQAADPVRQERNLVRIAMRVPSAGHAAGQPLRLTVLLDTSGSMEREDRAAAVHKAMGVLVSLLGPEDRVTLIGFARQPRLIAESLPGDQAGRLVDLVERTPPEGGTNLEEALKLGGELARRQHLDGAQNRIVVLTDGATNLGNADPGRLAADVASLRQEGIAFDACGVGIDGVNDEVLEALTRKGGGRYYLVTTPESADAGFARELAGAFRPAAENVKVQVRFNPARVGHYRLIGFEQNRLQERDFRNDKVGAAALAAGEDAVALYDIEPLAQGEGELGEVFVRFRVPATGAVFERSWTLPYEPYAPAFDRASPSLQLAGTAAFVAEKLQGGPQADAIRLAPLVPVVNTLRGRYANEARVQTLVSMFEQIRRLEKD